MEFEIRDYQYDNGKYQVREFLTELALNNPKLWAVTTAKINKLKDRDAHWTIVKPLKDGLFEIKPRIGSDTARVIFCFGKARVIWLLVGFVKKDKKRQQKYINEARKLMKECVEKEKKI